MTRLLNLLMEKITFRRDSPYWLRQMLYYVILIFLGRIRVSFKKESAKLLALKKDGIIELGNISETGIDPGSLREAIMSCDFVAKYDSSGKLIKKIYDHQSLVQLPQVLSFATNGITIDLCTQFFHSEPSVAYIAAWETFANHEEDVSEMFFHMDHHGHRFLKKFCYLTDIGVGDGEHRFIKGTTERSGFYNRLKMITSDSPGLYQALKTKRLLRGDIRLCNESIESFFKESLTRVTGVTGTTFLEDTYGLHRGSPVLEGKPRLILQVVYVPLVLKKDSSREIDVQIDAAQTSKAFGKVMKDSYSVIVNSN